MCVCVCVCVCVCTYVCTCICVCARAFNVKSLAQSSKKNISRSSQCSTTGVTKAVVCVILSVGWCI